MTFLNHIHQIVILDQLKLIMLERMPILLVIDYVFDIRHEKNLKAAQPIRVKFKFFGEVLQGYMVMF